MKRKIFCGCLLALAALFAAWMLWPRPLASGLEMADSLWAFVITDDVEVTYDEGIPIARPVGNVESYDEIPADSAAGTAIWQVLENHTYHLCLDTLTGKQGLEDIGQLQVNLYGDGWDLKVFSGTRKAFLNGRLIRLDCWGDDDAARLCEALAAALRGE